MASCCGPPNTWNATPGCHVAKQEHLPWISDVGVFDPEDYGLTDEVVANMGIVCLNIGCGTWQDEVPDISVDPDDHMLTVINTSREVDLIAALFGSDSPQLMEDGTETPCVTLVLELGPRQTMDVGRVELGTTPIEEIALESDVSLLEPHPSPETFDPAHVFAFPLADTQGPYLCTQGFGGAFTHFLRHTHHAVDFACPCGTPVTAIGAGTVVEVRDGNAAGGIHVSRLFGWNSVMVEMAGGVHAEYVHIMKGSVKVAVGERVESGQVICLAGDVGFCPSPHLHLQLYPSKDPKAPSLRFALRGDDGVDYVPQQGQWYSRGGAVTPPLCEPCGLFAAAHT